MPKMTNQKKTDYICISKESEGPAPDTLDETLPYKAEYKELFLNSFAIYEQLGVIPEERKADVERIKAMLNED